MAENIHLMPGLRQKADTSADSAGLPVELNSVPEPAAVVDASGTVTATNDLFAALLGYTPGEPVGRPFSDFCDIDRLISLYGIRGGPGPLLLAAGPIRGAAVEYIRKDGSRVEVSFSASPLPSPAFASGRVLTLAMDMRRVASLFRSLKAERSDLGDRVRYLEEFREGVFEMLKDIDRNERELESACRQLKEAQAQLVHTSKMKALGELSSGLAHELSQPLTVIKGMADSLLRASEKGCPDFEKLLLVFKASKKMEDVITHLKVFARREEPLMEPLDLNAVVRDSYLMVRELLARSSIETRFNLGTLPKVLGSTTRLEQVVINLVTNARDAMPEGGRLIIDTRTVPHRGVTGVELAISDTGSGIPDHAAPNIFDPFFTTKERGAGTGLGLSISYGIIKEHGGEIAFSGRPEGGTTFRIRIPALT